MEITVVNFATGEPLSGFSLNYGVNGYYEISGLPLNKVFVVVVEKGKLKMKNLAFSQAPGQKEKSVDLTPTSTVTTELASENATELLKIFDTDISGVVQNIEDKVNEYYSANTSELETLETAVNTGTLPSLDAVKTVAITEQMLVLTVNVSPGGAGTVSPNTGTYLKGTRVKLQVEANSPWLFVDWTGEVNDNEIEMTENKTITANFDTHRHSLTIIVSPSDVGYVYVMDKNTGETGLNKYIDGAEVGLSAVVNPDKWNDWIFSHWDDNADEPQYGPNKNTIMKRDRVLTANFAEIYKIQTVVFDRNDLANVIINEEGTHRFPKAVRENDMYKLPLDIATGTQTQLIKEIRLAIDDTNLYVVIDFDGERQDDFPPVSVFSLLNKNGIDDFASVQHHADPKYWWSIRGYKDNDGQSGESFEEFFNDTPANIQNIGVDGLECMIIPLSNIPFTLDGTYELMVGYMKQPRDENYTYNPWDVENWEAEDQLKKGMFFVGF